MIDTKLLKAEEKAVFSLRSLYRKYGYLPFNMSKFEEYEFYIRNKDFLVSDRIIAFNDTNGKLLALKPDVTLSIIKNGEDFKNTKQKVYYNENVYRVSDNTHQFKEIMQAGLECIGDIDLYDIFEVVSLAAQSLSLISQNFLIEVSHLGVISAVLDSISDDTSFRQEALSLISKKNTHDLKRLCEKYNIQNSEILVSLVSVYGERKEVIKNLKELIGDIAKDALSELESISDMLSNSLYSDKIVFDFSVVNDMNYYNGIVFKGFLDGVCDGVLAGGQYDNLMRKMNRSSRAVGFALYLDLLEQLENEKKEADVDVLLVYGDVQSTEVMNTVNKIINAGKTVSAQKCIPEKLRYKEIMYLGKDKQNA